MLSAPARVAALLVLSTVPLATPPPKPIGRLVDIGGRSLHLHCRGGGAPTVVIETGLGDFSFDWTLVQSRVERFARVCSYDRAGYAWSDVGPSPRTFDQLNLELHDALARAGERRPFVLVGHSFGGGPVRRYVERYREESAGLVLVDVIGEDQYIRMGPTAGRIRDGAKGVAIPNPVSMFSPPPRASFTKPVAVEPPYDRLPAKERALHGWAASLPEWEKAEDEQKQWSAEYYARWSAASQDSRFGALPLLVLARASGGYPDNLNVPAAELERTRLDAQRALARLSTVGAMRLVDAGHNMHLEAPDEVERAIRTVIDLARAGR